MHPTSLPLQTHSPAFGYLSPPIDSGDDASDDGESLQTPLTEHKDHQLNDHHPYSVYQQHNHTFHSSPFHPYSPPHHHHHHQDPLEAKDLKPDSQTTAFSSFSALLTPSASEHLSTNPLDGFFPYSSPPSNALDLPNTTLEFDPFAASFGANMIHDHAMHSDDPAFASSGQGFHTHPTSGSSVVDSSLDLPPLPALAVESFGDISSSPIESSLLFEPPSGYPSQSENLPAHTGRMYSARFPEDHILNPFFVRAYVLNDELGAGGYGFVMTARHREHGHEVAVKFIIKDKVPEHCWWQDEILGRVPTEVLVMSLLNHGHIVKCLDLFEDDLYFYLVQELHGTPWVSCKKSKKGKQITAPGNRSVPTPTELSTPSLTPSPSTESEGSFPVTPPQLHVSYAAEFPSTRNIVTLAGANAFVGPSSSPLSSSQLSEHKEDNDNVEALPVLLPPEPRPSFSRRASYDLFECIEQSKHKRLSENQARYIFAQVVEAVHYLDSQGITHCDIKDENLVIDADLKVKLIDFGSAVVADPSEPRPYYTLFYGTTAYAASEILLKEPYLAPPAEIWTLGVLLSYLLTGNSPFPSEQDAIDARIVIKENMSGKLSRAALGLMQRCLEKDPRRRADIEEVRGHRWLQGVLESGPLRD